MPLSSHSAHGYSHHFTGPNILDTAPYGIRMSGPDIISDSAAILSKVINHDHGIDETKKKSLLAMIDHPDTFNRLASGGLGVALVRSTSAFEKLSKPVQILVSLAGFGVGRALYDTLSSPDKFSSYNSSTGATKIKI
jgi:hypothetical protein